jgi:hypothetical protein
VAGLRNLNPFRAQLRNAFLRAGPRTLRPNSVTKLAARLGRVLEEFLVLGSTLVFNRGLKETNATLCWSSTSMILASSERLPPDGRAGRPPLPGSCLSGQARALTSRRLFLQGPEYSWSILDQTGLIPNAARPDLSNRSRQHRLERWTSKPRLEKGRSRYVSP